MLLYFSMTKDSAKLEKYSAATIALVLSCAFLALSFYVVPSFERLFAQAEIELPLVTKRMIGMSPYWSIFGAVAIIGCILIFWSKKKSGWLLLAIAGLALLIIIPSMIYTMYDPIFQL